MIDDLWEEIEARVGKKLKWDNLLSDKATALVLKMAEDDDINIVPYYGTAARCRRAVSPQDLLVVWLCSTRDYVFRSADITSVGAATCNLNGIQYWCVLTK